MKRLRLTAFLCLIAGFAHAQTKISQMPPANALDGTELIPVIQGGANARAAASDLLTYIQAHISSGGSPGGSGTALQYKSGTSFGGISGTSTDGSRLTISTSNTSDAGALNITGTPVADNTSALMMIQAANATATACSDPSSACNTPSQSGLVINLHGFTGAGLTVQKDGVAESWITPSGNAHFLGGIDLFGALWFPASGTNVGAGQFNGVITSPPYGAGGTGIQQIQLGEKDNVDTGATEPFTVYAQILRPSSYSSAAHSSAASVQGLDFHIYGAPSVGPLAGGKLVFSTFTNTAANAVQNTTVVDAMSIAGATGSTAGAVTFAVPPILSTITGSTQCLQVNTSGVVAGSGGACGGGSGTVTETGTHTSGSMAVFSTAPDIITGNLSGDCTTTNTLVISCTGISASNITTGTLPAAQLPTPTLTTLGGVKAINGVTHQWIRALSTTGAFTQTQPACADISDGGVFCNGTDGANLTGTISVNRFNSGTGASSSTFLRGDGTWVAAGGGSGTVTETGTHTSGTLAKFSTAPDIVSADLTGDVTTAAGLVTTVASIAGVAVGTPTGTGNVVFSAAPTMTGTVTVGSLATGGGNSISFGSRGIITSPAAGKIQFGATDAAAPVAQFLKVQNVVAGTTDTAGADWKFEGSQGTGTGAGGKLLFYTAPAAGSTASTQNAEVLALTIDSAGIGTWANAPIMSALTATSVVCADGSKALTSTCTSATPSLGSTTVANLTDSGLTASQPVCTNGSKVLITSTSCALSASATQATSAPAGTASTTKVMAGVGVTLTPATTGRLILMASGSEINSTASDGCTWQLSYSQTGSLGADGDPLKGTQVGSAPATVHNVNTQKMAFSQQYIVTGLTTGVSTWADLAFAANVGGTCTLSGVNFSAVEF